MSVVAGVAVPAQRVDEEVLLHVPAARHHQHPAVDPQTSQVVRRRLFSFLEKGQVRGQRGSLSLYLLLGRSFPQVNTWMPPAGGLWYMLPSNLCAGVSQEPGLRGAAELVLMLLQMFTSPSVAPGAVQPPSPFPSFPAAAESDCAASSWVSPCICSAAAPASRPEHQRQRRVKDVQMQDFTFCSAHLDLKANMNCSLFLTLPTFDS